MTAAVVAGPDGGHVVKLAWVPPPRSEAVQFFLEVRAQIDDRDKELLARVSPENGASIEVPGNASLLFWRVSDVYPALRQYAATDWQTVDLGTPVR